MSTLTSLEDVSAFYSTHYAAFIFAFVKVKIFLVSLLFLHFRALAIINFVNWMAIHVWNRDLMAVMWKIMKSTSQNPTKCVLFNYLCKSVPYFMRIYLWLEGDMLRDQLNGEYMFTIICYVGFVTSVELYTNFHFLIFWFQTWFEILNWLVLAEYFSQIIEWTMWTIFKCERSDDERIHRNLKYKNPLGEMRNRLTQVCSGGVVFL